MTNYVARRICQYSQCGKVGIEYVPYFDRWYVSVYRSKNEGMNWHHMGILAHSRIRWWAELKAVFVAMSASWREAMAQPSMFGEPGPETVERFTLREASQTGAPPYNGLGHGDS